MGPAFGQPMDSYRAETYGQLSIIMFLFLLQQYFETSCPRVQIACDNQSAVDRVLILRDSKRPQFPNDTLQPSWDTLQAISRHLRLLPKVTLIWVKGHQDKNTPFAKLPVLAQLNVRADKLAGKFQHIWHHTYPQPLFLMIEGTGCNLMIDGETITSKHYKNLLDVRRTANIKQYLKKKFSWNHLSMISVDWRAYNLAVSNWSPPTAPESRSSTFLPKFLHRWLPVGKHVARYNPNMYSSFCPSCSSNIIEDQTHMLRCPCRTTWQRDMKQALISKCEKLATDPILVRILIEALFCWLRQSPFPATTFSANYQALIASQESIGWEHLFYGRWSTEWDSCQLGYLQDREVTLSHKNNGPAWASQLIRVIWDHCHAAWLERNLARHGADAEHRKEIALAHAKEKIRTMYALRPLCRLQRHRRWFHASPEAHFAIEPHLHQLQAWLRTYGEMITAISRRQQRMNQQGQMGIAEAFERLYNL